MKRLSKKQVIKIHGMLISQTGGSDGIRIDAIISPIELSEEILNRCGKLLLNF